MPGYNVGANINITNNNIGFETGIDIVHKQFQVRAAEHELNAKSRVKNTAFNMALEFPCRLAVSIYKHDKNDIAYNLYFVSGISYEILTTTGYSHAISSSSGGGGGNAGYVVFGGEEFFRRPATYNRDEWLNFIAGFKINTIVRGLGLIDYGLTFHIPSAVSSSYYAETYMMDQLTGQRIVYKGEFFPRMAYVNFKLCYYFLNYDSRFKRIKYKSGEYYWDLFNAS